MLRRWFAVVVWIGILGNWTFAILAFTAHEWLLRTFNLGAPEASVWMFNYAVLLAILSAFYIPAAHDPFRYSTNAWLLIVGRLVPAATFFAGVALGLMPRGFLTLGVGDATIGLLALFLLLALRSQAAGKTMSTAS